MKRLFITLIVLLTFAMAQAQSPAKLKSGAWIGSFNSDPSFHIEGWVLYNTTDNIVKFSNGTTWIPLGFNLASNYSVTGTWSFNNDVDFNDGIDLNGNTISGVDDAIDDDQVYNKGQVDDLLENIPSSNVYTVNGTLPSNTSRSITLGTSTQFQFISGTEALTMLNNPSLGSLFSLDFDKLQIENDAVSFQANDTDAFKIYGKRGLQIELGNASGTKIVPNVGDSFRVSNATTGAIEYYTPPSNDLPFYDLDADTYTITEAQIENLTTIYVNANQTDVTITIPSTSLTGQNFINIQHLGSGTVTVIPATGVNLQQYVSTSAKSFILASIASNTWFLRDGDVTVSTYTPPATSTPPTYVGFDTFDTGGNSITVTGLTPTTGNLLVGVVSGNFGTFTTPTGWTLAGSTNVGTFTSYLCYYKISDGSETSVSFNGDGGTSTLMFAQVLEYSGVNTSTPIEDFKVITGAQSATVNTQSMTSTGTNRLAISIFLGQSVANGDGAIVAEPLGYTNNMNIDDTRLNDGWHLAYSKTLATATTETSVNLQYPISANVAGFNFFIIPE